MLYSSFLFVLLVAALAVHEFAEVGANKVAVDHAGADGGGVVEPDEESAFEEEIEGNGLDDESEAALEDGKHSEDDPVPVDVGVDGER